MYKYKISIKKVSGQLNESAIPNSSLVVKSKTKLSDKEAFAKASKYLSESYNLVLESADVNPDEKVVTIEKIRKDIESQPARSAWQRGVKEYALEMVEQLEEYLDYTHKELPQDSKGLKEVLLNGARDWNQSSYGGSWLIYNGDIAERMCSPSELKKVRGGERNPNSRESWLDVQARALAQACVKVVRAAFYH